MNMLLIACALVATSAALVAFVSFTRALRCADEAAEALRAAERAAAKLNAMAGRVVALEGAHESLLKQHRKLSGRFYAITAPPDLNDLHDAQEVRGIPDSRPPLASPFCANYGQAQLEGPLSPAAACACGYCTEMRARREAFRSESLPKTNSERHDAAKAGLENRRYRRGE